MKRSLLWTVLNKPNISFDVEEEEEVDVPDNLPGDLYINGLIQDGTTLHLYKGDVVLYRSYHVFMSSEPESTEDGTLTGGVKGQ